MKSTTVSDVLAALEDRAPSALAESWDNVGLLIGSARSKTSGVVVATDLSSEVLKIAKRKRYSLIVVHHPTIFPRQKGISRLIRASEPDDSLSSLMIESIESGVSIASCHTNFDRCSIEVADAVAREVGFKSIGRVFEEGGEPIKKLVVFVPETHVDSVRVALSNAGAGQIGRYDSCSFETRGTGTFRALEGANPTIGKKHRVESVKESRLELVFPAGRRSQVLRALRASHPYEEIAYDLFSVDQSPSREGLVRGIGYGVYGDFASQVSLAAALSRVKKTFKVKSALVTPAISSFGKNKKIKRVAFTPGKGSSFASAVRSSNCDLFVTGELGYHAALELARSGVSTIELGHRESEYFFAPTIASWLREAGVQTAICQTRAQSIV